jgi:hypothetical protein
VSARGRAGTIGGLGLDAETGERFLQRGLAEQWLFGGPRGGSGLVHAFSLRAHRLIRHLLLPSQNIRRILEPFPFRLNRNGD